MKQQLQRMAGLGALLSVLSIGATAKAAPTTKAPVKTKQPTTTKGAMAKASVKSVVKVKKRKPKVKKRKLIYDMYFGSGKVGQMVQEETMYPNGKTVVQTSSQSTIRIFFRTFKNKLNAHMIYRKGKLSKFSIDTTQRNQRTIVSGHRTSKGMFVKRTVGHKTTEKIFPFKDFQATSSDLSMPIHQKRFRLKRKMLQLPQQKIVKQRIDYKGKVKRKFLGKSMTAIEMKAKGPRGTAHLLFTPSGRMLQMKARISLFGSFKIRLRKVIGLPL